ncbi:hypothetical protein ACSSS7_002114 [Eimeria intestinalis]
MLLERNRTNTPTPAEAAVAAAAFKTLSFWLLECLGGIWGVLGRPSLQAKMTSHEGIDAVSDLQLRSKLQQQQRQQQQLEGQYAQHHPLQEQEHPLHQQQHRPKQLLQQRQQQRQQRQIAAALAAAATAATTAARAAAASDLSCDSCHLFVEPPWANRHDLRLLQYPFLLLRQQQQTPRALLWRLQEPHKNPAAAAATAARKRLHSSPRAAWGSKKSSSKRSSSRNNDKDRRIRNCALFSNASLQEKNIAGASSGVGVSTLSRKRLAFFPSCSATDLTGDSIGGLPAAAAAEPAAGDNRNSSTSLSGGEASGRLPLETRDSLVSEGLTATDLSVAAAAADARAMEAAVSSVAEKG